MQSEFESVAIDLERDETWSADRAAALYFVDRWGEGYFGVNGKGHVAVRPIRGEETEVDLFQVVDDLQERGIGFPILIRFQDLLKSRVDHLNGSFRKAIERHRYGNTYEGIYPIKVNQLREVVEEIVASGESYGHGLECGSKSELAATLPYLAERDMLLLCNGSKDAGMMRLMLAVQRLGKRVFPVLERADELPMLAGVAEAARMRASVGLRVRLTTRGAGLWSESGGENSKFGLSLTEVLDLTRRIRTGELPLDLRLLHFHLGSQIADRDTLRSAVEEAARIYAWLREQGIEVEYFDVGGGLGVSYEAGNPEALGTINYDIEEYADVVIDALGSVCEAEGVPDPIVVSESGRAITAPHSVLIIEAISSRRKDESAIYDEDGASHPLVERVEALLARLNGGGTDAIDADDLVTCLQSARRLRNEMIEAFRAGKLTVENKASFERSYWATCLAIDRHADRQPARQRPELAALSHQVVDHYQCNFSIFRSMVDYWAIGQRFPIMPVHRLLDPPTRRGILVDLTCDSDGKVDRFVSVHGDKRYLELHEIQPGEPYYLGLFLMGAYQDIMGDMHNLFGRVTEVHVYADEEEPDNFYIEEILPGATVQEQLELVQYHPHDLERRMGNLIQGAVKSGSLRPKEGVKLLNDYRRLFPEMTYLNTGSTE